MSAAADPSRSPSAASSPSSSPGTTSSPATAAATGTTPGTTPDTPPLAVVTGASSGIGLELARLCAKDGFSLVIAADQGDLDAVADELRSSGAPHVDALQADLATARGIDQLCERVGDRPVDALLCNAGHGLGHAFLDQDIVAARHVVDTNITGTLDLVHRLGRRMRERNRGRILFTGSIAGVMPGAFQAVYNGTKAFVDSFAVALRNELKDTGITVTVLMPGATDTAFFERAGLQDTKVGTDRDAMSDPRDVARDGFDAMMRGEAKVISGFRNKLEAMVARVTPDTMLAEQHRKMAEPGTASKVDADDRVRDDEKREAHALASDRDEDDDRATAQEGRDVDDLGHSPLRERGEAATGLPEIPRTSTGRVGEAGRKDVDRDLVRGRDQGTGRDRGE